MSSESPVQQKEEGKKPRFGVGLLLAIVILYLVDQATKMIVVWKFYAPFDLAPFMSTEKRLVKVPVIEDFFNIVRVHNTGVAFGMGNATEWSKYVFLAVPVIALVILVVLYRKGFFGTKWLKIGWALLVAGICGNLTDRLVQGFIMNSHYRLNMSFMDCLRNGAVIDFIDIRVPFTTWHWPSFNVADSCICIAAVIFLAVSFFQSGKEAKPADPKP